jgi:uncharacterized glyoxalase superfamily protein PhnB
MSSSGATFSQLNLVVSDMDAAVDFWQRLGLEITVGPDGRHASATLAEGIVIEWDTADFAARWDSGSRGPAGSSTVIGFAVPTRQDVDDLYADLVVAGYQGHQLPYDTFWGARYAIVDDPDGNAAGIMSPVEPDRRFWPPAQAPGAAVQDGS